MRRVQEAAALTMCAVAIVLLVAEDVAAQRSPKCTPDVPLIVEIMPFPDADGNNISVLGGDTKGNVYKDGVDGVYKTVINRCSGSNDATMGLVTSRRSMAFDFSGDAGSTGWTIWPTWTRSSDGTYAHFFTKPFLNVRNILWGRNGGVAPSSDGSYTFQTRMSIGYIKGPGDKSDYNLRFMPEGLGVPYPNPLQMPPADVNSPESTVPVTVVDNPNDCTWTVTVDTPFRATLYKTTSEAHAGQFYMPFKLRLQTKTCPF